MGETEPIWSALSLHSIWRPSDDDSCGRKDFQPMSMQFKSQTHPSFLPTKMATAETPSVLFMASLFFFF